jgi:hypothetical protein
MILFVKCLALLEYLLTPASRPLHLSPSSTAIHFISPSSTIHYFNAICLFLISTKLADRWRKGVWGASEVLSVISVLCFGAARGVIILDLMDEVWGRIVVTTGLCFIFTVRTNISSYASADVLVF